MAYRVPFVDPRQHYRRYRKQFDAAILGCLKNGDLIQRQQLRDFEARLASFVGTKYAVGLNSGYHALAFSLLAAKIGPGDEVITVAHTFAATISAIVHCGATPVLVEVRDDFNMDPEAFERAITPRTKAVIPVHLNGRVCDMDRILSIAARRGLTVIEDACQSLGATYRGRKAGSFGLTGCWSFYPFKILGGVGDGGAITTNDPEVARTATLLRYNGEDRETGEFHCHGYTALLDNVQAAVLDWKLQRLPEWIDHRRRIAGLYRQELEGVGDLRLPHFEGREYRDAFQNYVIRSRRRDVLREFLRESGVETLVSWPKPIWEHKKLGLRNPGLPGTVSICREVLSLPMSAETTPAQVKIIGGVIRKFFDETKKAPAARKGKSTRPVRVRV